MPENFWLALATLLGTIIGAGMFAIPFVFSRSGWLLAGLYFLLVYFIVLSLNLMFGEVILRTRERHRLVGYAGYYLGKRAKTIETLSILFGATGSMLAYIILSGEFLHMLFPLVDKFEFAVLAWAVVSLLVYLGIRSIALSEVIMGSVLVLTFGLIVGLCVPNFHLGNITLFNPDYLFLPFGIFLFSMVGWNAIPEISSILKNKRHLKKVIVSALSFAVVFYFIFGLMISGVSGPSTTDQPFMGLMPFLGKIVLLLGGVFGLMAVLTSFLVLGNYLKNTLFVDYNVPYLVAFLLSVLPAFALYVGGIQRFVQVVGMVGSVVGVIDGTMIILTFKKAKKQGELLPAYSFNLPKFFMVLIVIVLALGVAGEIASMIS